MCLQDLRIAARTTLRTRTHALGGNPAIPFGVANALRLWAVGSDGSLVTLHATPTATVLDQLPVDAHWCMPGVTPNVYSRESLGGALNGPLYYGNTGTAVNITVWWLEMDNDSYSASLQGV